MNLYPLMLDMRNRLVVVVGGGKVGARKAKSLLDAGATVRLVDPGCRDTHPDIHLINEPYRPMHLDEATLVFAAATPEVNTRVVADARERRLWVNSADDPEAGDFLVPASVRKGDLLLAVSTSGVSPGVAKLVRNLLDADFDDSWSEWLAILRDLRSNILSQVPDPTARRFVFDRLSDPVWLEQIRVEGHSTAESAMRQVVEDALRR
ncbi:MAG: bifunctional precorrin-2 dehydrogenase/sirohydrochlorin ferrochelatase [Planctomycetes bacterium]|nr:bifunctional precorrin-2 dehydrogenase/sirohydrochlorin ferrochelatase [Planctomycetota bacterium]